MSTLLGNSKRSGSDMELVFAALRRIYDGSFSRDNGTTGETLRWHGEVVVLGAVTHSIDDYASFSDALGARFLYFRVRDVDPADRRSTRTRRRMPVENRRENARKLAHRVIRDGRARVRDVELSDALLDIIDDAAEVARVGRGSVPRESFGQREFRGMPQVEAPYRLRQQLERLARALCALLLDEETVARLVDPGGARFDPQGARHRAPRAGRARGERRGEPARVGPDDRDRPEGGPADRRGFARAEGRRVPGSRHVRRE
jgi:hypothetical protein